MQRFESHWLRRKGSNRLEEAEEVVVPLSECPGKPVIQQSQVSGMDGSPSSIHLSMPALLPVVNLLATPDFTNLAAILKLKGKV